jgi:hypothetical protein
MRKLSLVGILLAAVVWLWLTPVVAQQIAVSDKSTSLAWLEDGAVRGMRLVILDERWKFVPGAGGTRFHLSCEVCDAAQTVSGWVRFGLPPFDPQSAGRLATDLNRDIHDRIGLALETAAIDSVLLETSHVLDDSLKTRAAGSPFPVLIGGRPGFGRVVVVQVRGAPRFAAAVAMEEGRFALFGVFGFEDGRRLSEADLQAAISALAIEHFRPDVDPAALQPLPRARPKDEFPLGDARRKAIGQAR